MLALGHRATLAKWVSLVVSALALLLSIPLWSWFKTGTAEMQFVERAPWISTIHAEFYIGVDGISMPLIFADHLYHRADRDCQAGKKHRGSEGVCSTWRRS